MTNTANMADYEAEQAEANRRYFAKEISADERTQLILESQARANLHARMSPEKADSFMMGLAAEKQPTLQDAVRGSQTMGMNGTKKIRP